MDKPALLIDEARRWVGTPYVHQGRSRSGIDCIGFIIKVGQAAGFLPPNFERTNYSAMPDNNELTEKCERYFTRLEAPEPGCVLTLRWYKRPRHMALYTGETIIHASITHGCVVEHGYRGHWVKLTDSAWRF